MDQPAASDPDGKIPIKGRPARGPFSRTRGSNTLEIVPSYHKRHIAARYPFLEICQRLMWRLRPTANLEILVAAIAVYQAAHPVYEYALHLFQEYLMSQVCFSEHDPMGIAVSEYVFHNRLNSGPMDPFSATFCTWAIRIIISRVVSLALDGTEALLPRVGFRLFVFSRRWEGQYGTPRIVNSLSTLGWSQKPLQEFITQCCECAASDTRNFTTVRFRGRFQDQWDFVTKANRKWDTIDIDSRTKADLIQDAEHYYSPQGQEFYRDCGLPVRRGYLFQGPSGTGKTTVSLALAGHLRCDLYVIDLSAAGMSDHILHNLFLSLPRKCVVVLEAIDSSGIIRQQQAANPGQANSPTPGSSQTGQHHGNQSSLTLSGLLNAIDGVASQESRLLILTSNNPDALDKSLIRPGRIDMKFHFGCLSKPCARSMFERLVGCAALQGGKFTHRELRDAAETFAEKLDCDLFTPAEVQNFLQSCRGDPMKALHEVDAWVRVRRTNHTNGTNGNGTNGNGTNGTNGGVISPR